MNWSKIMATGVFYVAEDHYDIGGSCRSYHNINHIVDCYRFLKANNAPYDEDLDFAVLFHDVVYDNQPNKEIRSADLMLDLYPDRVKAHEIILATAHHMITDYMDESTRWMIRADLSGLADREKTVQNYFKIMQESMALYGCTAREFAENNYNFMLVLLKAVDNNILTDSAHADFWMDVEDGIRTTKRLSNAIRV